MAVKAVFQSIQLIKIIFIVAADVPVEVSQIPERIYATTGTNLTFYCTFSVFQDKQAIIYWWKLGENEFIHFGSDNRKRLFIEKGRASLQLLNISVQDSGVYYCRLTCPGKRAANGSGSTLVVRASPTPVRIVSRPSESTAHSSLSLVCEMDLVFLDGLTITWYKNNRSIENGINTTTKQLSGAGLYKVSSYLEEARPIQGRTVFVCLMSQATLQIPAMAIYLVPISRLDDDNIFRTYVRIFACAGFVLMFLALLAIIRMWHIFTNHKANRQGNDEASHCGNSTFQETIDNSLTYATVQPVSSMKNGNPRTKEKGTEYAEIRNVHQKR
ncbi:tyrosine-protein phosphatase non-receptor type substrate 1 [Chiloscyllium plagiosum]|uniref:tyrosine-protein phosphatase non-receptor type substrate 1 n=1 Tax=Chiloscyllium plagiosum TaxID=36176 RepID=UPI001CB866AC|nr:tyrosine-protein phosphatase non-receptor type substrate 1 [Chiloscyllium plagiosum]